MSKVAMDWAFAQDVGDWQKKSVLVALSWHADEDGVTSAASEPPFMAEHPAMTWAYGAACTSARDKFVLVAVSFQAGVADLWRVDMAELKIMTELPAIEIKAAFRRLAAQGHTFLDGDTVHLMRGHTV
jgi:hypothetical protein